MYNRYIRNENGGYTRVPQEDTASHRPPDQQSPPKEVPTAAPLANRHTQSVPKESSRGHSSPDGLSGILRGFLDQLRLDRVDTGDLLLLGLLFFLFREKADEELLVALGLLLIL